MARLFELSVLAINLVVLALALIVGAYFSAWAGFALFLFATLGAFHVIYNYDGWFVRQMMKVEPDFFLRLCEIGAVGLIRALVGKVPSSPRCRFCQVPFGGIGSILRIKPSSKNPNYCRSCFEALPVGTVEMGIGILFADIRGYTAWAERHSASDAAEALAKFYSLAEDVLTSDDAFVEFVGDQVMAIYVPVMPSLAGRAPQAMLSGAKRFIKAVQMDEQALPIGIGLNFGPCEVGNVKKGSGKDFTAVGDTVNTTARLQSFAKASQIVMSKTVFDTAAVDADDACLVEILAKGKSEPIEAYVLDHAPQGLECN